jgi:quercetin dioxygenase-like cupin family protein
MWRKMTGIFGATPHKSQVLKGDRIEEPTMIERFLSMPSRRISLVAFGAAAILTLAIAGGARLAAQTATPASAAKHGIVRRMADVKFAPDDDVKCLNGVVENGDPATGPSTFVLKATSGCVVAPHYHTAEEQLIVVRGDVLTGMHGMKETLLEPGGFAMMPGKETHWFTCMSKEGCLMFVTFDRTYDIVWVQDEK